MIVMNFWKCHEDKTNPNPKGIWFKRLVQTGYFVLHTERPCGCCSFVGKRGNGPQAISIGV